MLTNFAESNALLALIENDEETARAILAALLPGELATLGTAARRLYELADFEYRAAYRRQRERAADQQRADAGTDVPATDPGTVPS